MKKLIFACACLALAGSMSAQIKNDKGTFTKPTTGEYAIETQMMFNALVGGAFSLNDPFLSNLSSGMSLSTDVSAINFPMLKVRKFVTDKRADRFLLNLSYGSNSTKTGDVKSSNSEVGIALGYGREKHFNGAERLSTYLGWEALVGLDMRSNKAGDAKESQTGIGVAVRGLTGMDYYFVPKVYLGIELGWGIGLNSYGKITDTETTKSNLTVTPFIVPSFRLGYRL